MSIDKISFGNKMLPLPMIQKAQQLLLKMNSQTKYISGDSYFNSNILACLKTDKGSLVDSTAMLTTVKDIYEGRVEIEIGKVRIDINPKNGEILQSEKPWFLTWKKAYNRIEKFIDNLQFNYENQEIVEKRFIKLHGLTEKGAHELRKIQS